MKAINIKKMEIVTLFNSTLNDKEEYRVVNIGSADLNASKQVGGSKELKELLRERITDLFNGDILEYFNDSNVSVTEDDVNYCINELAIGHASNIAGEDFYWGETEEIFTKEQENGCVSNKVEKELTYKERVKLMADRIAAFGSTMVIWNDKEFHFAFESGWQYRTAHGEMWVKEVKSDNIIVTDGEKNWEIPTSVLDEKFMYQLYITFIKVCERNLTEVAYKEVTLAIGEE